MVHAADDRRFHDIPWMINDANNKSIIQSVDMTVPCVALAANTTFGAWNAIADLLSPLGVNASLLAYGVERTNNLAQNPEAFNRSIESIASAHGAARANQCSFMILLDAVFEADASAVKTAASRLPHGPLCGLRVSWLRAAGWSNVMLDPFSAAVQNLVSKLHRAGGVGGDSVFETLDSCFSLGLRPTNGLLRVLSDGHGYEGGRARTAFESSDIELSIAACHAHAKSKASI